MARSDSFSRRLAKLSDEKRALLEKRLRGQRGDTHGVTVQAPPIRPPAHRHVDPRQLREAVRQPAAPLVDRHLWETLVAVGYREARARQDADDLREEHALEAGLDRRAVASVCLAFAAMGVFREAGESFTPEELEQRCGVVSDHRRALRRWLEMLLEDGLLERDGAAFRSREPLPAVAAAAELDNRERQFFSDNLTAVLRGEKHALEFFIPGGSSEKVEENYTRSPTFRYCNAVSSRLLAAQADALPAGRTLRILEVGAGTGGTSTSLFPVLPPERSLYLFTDVSRFFTDRASAKFGRYPFILYAVLDVEKDPVAQKIPARAFDWVVAAHVLHATCDLRRTLAHVRRLLAPGGVLLLLEETRFLRKFNFTMGFLPGFDRFQDHDLRRLHPLLSSSQWRELLLANGFGDFASFTDPDALPQKLGVDVMLARLAEDT